MIYRLYCMTPNGYRKQGECEYEDIIFALDNLKEYNPELQVIVIEHDEDTNTDSIFFCGVIGNYEKGKTLKI